MSSGAPLTDEQLQALGRLDACVLANAIETFQVRLRNEGFVDYRVHCLFPELAPMVGYAATVRIRGSAPPTAGSALPGPQRLVGLHRDAPRAARGGGAGHGRAARAVLARRRGAHERAAGARLHRRGHQRLGARHPRGAQRRLPLFRRPASRCRTATCTSWTSASRLRSADLRFPPASCCTATCTACSRCRWASPRSFRRPPPPSRRTSSS